MSTQTDTPTLVVASFQQKGDDTYLMARTSEGVDLAFKVDTMAVAVMALTIDSCLLAHKARMEAEMGQAPQPPAAPDTTEGLEG